MPQSPDSDRQSLSGNNFSFARRKSYDKDILLAAGQQSFIMILEDLKRQIC